MTNLPPKNGTQTTLPPEGRPVARLDELFGSLKLRRPVASVDEERRAAQAAMAREAATEGLE